MIPSSPAPEILAAAIILCLLGIGFTIYMLVHLLVAIICCFCDTAEFLFAP